MFPRVSTSCEGMKSGASKEGGEREREQQLLKAEAREREREDSKLALIGE